MDDAPDTNRTRLPLVPLPDFVLFPHTELRLAFSAEDRAVVDDVLLPWGREGRVIGTVLLKPSWAHDDDEAEVFSSGTAGRLIGHEATEEGGCRLLLRGEYRFEVTEQLGGTPLPEAIVEPVAESFVSDVDPDVLTVRDALAQALGAFSDAQLEPPAWIADLTVDEQAPSSFEAFVNRVAAGIDVSPMRKLSLLGDPLLKRAHNLLSIVRSRNTLLALLQPYRHLAGTAEIN